jgi:GT2 family glycosyltransferase
MTERRSLKAVIVSYNSTTHLEACLRSLSVAAATFDVTTILVDNASQDGSAHLARSLGAKVIANGRNVGFASAVNQGLATRLADYVLLLNPDVVLESSTLTELITRLDNPMVGATGPCTVDQNGHQNTDGYYLKAPSLRQVFMFYTRLVPSFMSRRVRCRIYEECRLGAVDRQVEQIPGACLLTRSDVLATVGLLDEAYPIWFEDVDWCQRAKKGGYQLWYVGSATATHVGGASFRRWTGIDKEVVFYRSMLTFFSKHNPWKAPLVFVAVIVDRLVRLVATRRWHHVQFLAAYLKGSAPLPP